MIFSQQPSSRLRRRVGASYPSPHPPYARACTMLILVIPHLQHDGTRSAVFPLTLLLLLLSFSLLPRPSSESSCYGYDGQFSCSQRGACVGTDQCLCDTGYAGEECSFPSCHGSLITEGSAASLVCSGHGQCESGECFCDVGYRGTQCNTPTCGRLWGSAYAADEYGVCTGHGLCVGPNECECEDSFYGQVCEYSYCSSELRGCYSAIAFRRFVSKSFVLELGWADDDTPPRLRFDYVMESLFPLKRPSEVIDCDRVLDFESRLLVGKDALCYWESPTSHVFTIRLAKDYASIHSVTASTVMNVSVFPFETLGSPGFWLTLVAEVKSPLTWSERAWNSFLDFVGPKGREAIYNVIEYLVVENNWPYFVVLSVLFLVFCLCACVPSCYCCCHSCWLKWKKRRWISQEREIERERAEAESLQRQQIDIEMDTLKASPPYHRRAVSWKEDLPIPEMQTLNTSLGSETHELEPTVGMSEWEPEWGSIPHLNRTQSIHEDEWKACESDEEEEEEDGEVLYLTETSSEEEEEEVQGRAQFDPSAHSHSQDDDEDVIYVDEFGREIPDEERVIYVDEFGREVDPPQEEEVDDDRIVYVDEFGREVGPGPEDEELDEDRVIYVDEFGREVSPPEDDCPVIYVDEFGREIDDVEDLSWESDDSS